MDIRENKKGSIIVYSLLIMTVLLGIGFSMNTIFLRNLRNVSQARDSVIALYAADVGVEVCVYEARTGQRVDRTTAFETSTIDISANPDPQGQTTNIARNVPAFTLTNLADDSVVSADCTALGSASFGFRSTGTYRDSSRALEISQ